VCSSDLTSIFALRHLEQTLNEIWGVARSRSWARRFSDYLAVMVVAPISVGVAVSLATTLQSEPIVATLLRNPVFAKVYGLGLEQVPTLGIADNLIPKTSQPYNKWWGRPVCLCVCGAMAGLSGACWLLDLGHTPVPTRLVDGLTIPIAVILTGTLLLQGRGRTMLTIILIPIAVLCASLWKQTTYPITTMGYSVGLVVLGVIVLGAQWAYVRGLDKTEKHRWFYRIACAMELLGLVVIGFSPQLGIHRMRAIFFIGVSISSGGLMLMVIPVILVQLTRKWKTSSTL